MKIGPIRINISECTEGIYLRWYYNGFHTFLFQNGYEVSMSTESMGTQTTRFFSVISKVERPTRLKAEYSYQVTIEGITSANIGGFNGLLMAEKVMQYEGGTWREVDITRSEHLIREDTEKGYTLSFEITRKELPNTSSVYQKSLRLYLGDTLCDLDDDEIVPINKQVNDIAEMQDRQSDFTAQFKIRKTREMRDLFELSGETGINTNFPFENNTCRLISDNIEVITNGRLVLDKVDEQYYYVSILSGNLSFFKTIDQLKINDLTLASTDHTWDVATMVSTHAVDLDYVYPLCMPTEDGSLSAGSDDGDRIEMYAGWIWPFIKVKAIWDEIFSNAGWYDDGLILTNPVFNNLFMPISKLNIVDVKKYLYAVKWLGFMSVVPNRLLGFPSAVLINGTELFRTGYYLVPFTATYKVNVIINNDLLSYWYVNLYKNGIFVSQMPFIKGDIFIGKEYELDVAAVPGDLISIRVTPGTGFWDTNTLYSYTIVIKEIINASINYLAALTPRLNLPELSQVEFIKMICNMFGLIPEVNSRSHRIKFWNLSELYDNISQSRDWSAYLSERDDEIEFKFGDYAQNNYLRYKESEDVPQDEGKGDMIIEDDTLASEKDMVELSISTCEEVDILTNLFSVNVSRIGFNKWNEATSLYEQNKKIDPRIVYVDHVASIASPPYEKTFGIRPTVAPGGATDIDSPKKASSIDVAFSSLVVNYAGLSRLLTKTNLRRAKFNLPVYEVAGLKHYIPIYLSQYKAYFYVNKINNYVPGQLCTIDLIKL
jgi:hypothetical protein